MIEAYVVLANRIRSELVELERLIARAERAIAGSRLRPQDLEFYLDSAALNLHDVYSGFERIFRQIAAIVDNNVPSQQEWHKDLLRQMDVDLPGLRPAVLSSQTTNALDEYLRFRHIVRNVYAFSFQPDLIERLVKRARPVFTQTQAELLSFAEFLEKTGQD